MANDLKLQVLLNAIDKASGPLKKISASSLESARAIKQARERLKELSTQQKDVSAWRTQRTAADQTKQALDSARERVKALSQQFAATGAPTQAMTRDMRSAIREAQRLKQQHQQQSQQLQGLRSKLYGAGISTKDLGNHERQLREQIGATNATIGEQTRRLRLLSSQQAHTAKTKASLKHSYDRRKQFSGDAAISGAAGMGVGYGIGRGLYAPLQEGKSFAIEEQRVAALGLGKEDTSKAIQFAKEMKTYGTSVTENLTLVRDAMTVFADEHEAEMVAPTLAKMKFANHAMYGEEEGAENERKFMDMLKVIELRGGLASKEAFINQADIVQRVLTATGGRVGPNEWLNVIKTGGVAAKGIKDDAFYYQLEPLVQEMGGHRVGTAMMSAYSNIYQGRTTKRAANNLEALGLVDPTKVKHDKAGQISFLDVGAIKGSEIFRENQFEWLEKILLPQLKAKGITEKSQVLDTIGSIFSNRTASNLFAQMYLQREQIHKNARLNEGADGIDQLYEKGLDSVQGQELELLAQKANAYREMSSAILPTYVAALKSVTETIKGITAWMKENPAAASVMMKTLMFVGGLAAAFGALALVLASFVGPFAVINYGLGLFGTKAARSGGIMQRLFPTLIGLARNALPMLGQGVKLLAGLMSGVLMAAIRGIGVALMGLAANPVALAIAAIVIAVAGAAYLIYKNWDAVKAYVIGLWNEITAGFSGGIGGIITVLTNFTPIGILYRAFAEVLNYLGLDLPTRFTEFGSMIINGLVNGLMSGLGAVKQTITAIGDSTIGWFKEKLDIHSPSRVFAELGGFTMAGLTQGLEAGQQGPLNAVNDLSRKLTSAGSMGLGIAALPNLSVDTRAPISPTAVATYDSHDTYEINIHTSPGMDAVAIGRAVRAELARIESEKGARRRSKLADLE
ncbi:phage tail tape measure protein [Pseudomonas sp. MSSRFD41]|uniref:phage tail tape measure protein n=1 Tax=Pseudomonas sp. MSSRFD41 TaxID=1310370 RepID=UPI001C8B443C|nr:phage tail tape measure protein [Pseudomonas sp. MSSRFD41]